MDGGVPVSQAVGDVVTRDVFGEGVLCGAQG